MSAQDVLLAGVLVFMIGLVAIIGNMIMNNAVTNLVAVDVINDSEATVTALEAAEDVTERGDYLVFSLFIGLILAIIISGYLVGGHPIFMIAYFIVVVIGVVLGAILSNVWEEATAMTAFAATLGNFALTNHILLYLPYYMGVIGIIGLVVMFAKPQGT